MKKCVDCGFWFSRNACRGCGKPLCGICADWPSPYLLSPGKGLCEDCREKPVDGALPISPFTGESYDSRWGVIIKKI